MLEIQVVRIGVLKFGEFEVRSRARGITTDILPVLRKVLGPCPRKALGRVRK